MLGAAFARSPRSLMSFGREAWWTLKRCNSELASVRNSDGVRKITLIDTRTRNSLSVEMVDHLLEQIKLKEDDPQLRCIVIAAQGKVFSAGHNLKQLATEEGRTVFDKFNRLMMAIVECPVPVIAAVDGLAAAAGCQLVAQCDIAVSTPRSTYSTPGANFGVFCSTPGVPLSRAVPRSVAAYMLFTGLPINAQQALSAGLVSTLTDNLDEEVELITDSIKSKSYAIVKFGKQFFYRQLEMGLSAAYQEGRKTMLNNLLMKDGKEGLKSFAEKRKPVWTHHS